VRVPEAKAACARCPVSQACREHGLKTQEPDDASGVELRCRSVRPNLRGLRNRLRIEPTDDLRDVKPTADGHERRGPKVLLPAACDLWTLVGPLGTIAILTVFLFPPACHPCPHRRYEERPIRRGKRLRMPRTGR
jgi:hypothetical protein